MLVPMLNVFGGADGGVSFMKLRSGLEHLARTTPDSEVLKDFERLAKGLTAIWNS